MDTWEFARDVVQATAWPITAVILAFIFRPTFSRLATGLELRTLKIGPFETTWDRNAAPAREIATEQWTQRMQQESFTDQSPHILEHASDAPHAALVSSHAAVDSELRAVLRKAGADAPPVGTAELAQLAFEKNLISRKTRDAAEGLGHLHMLAMLDGGGHNIDTRHAIEFTALADATCYAIRQDAANRHGE